MLKKKILDTPCFLLLSIPSQYAILPSKIHRKEGGGVYYDYDQETQKYHIKKGEKIKSHNIAIETRAKYFIISFLKQTQRQNKK